MDDEGLREPFAIAFQARPPSFREWHLVGWTKLMKTPGAARRASTGIARLQGEGPWVGRGRPGADGGTRTRAPVVPRPWTAVIRHRRGARGRGRPSASSKSLKRSWVDRRGKDLVGLRQPARGPSCTPVGRDALFPGARGGSGGNCTRSGWATASRAELLHFAPGRSGAPRWIRTNIPRLSSACPALGRGVRGAASGFRPRDLLVGDEASCSLDHGRIRILWLPGQESNLQLAVSRTALRSDTECLAG